MQEEAQMIRLAFTPSSTPMRHLLPCISPQASISNSFLPVFSNNATSVLLPKLGIRPKYFASGDGYKGLEIHGPFDSIIVTAGAPIIPKPLMAQLKIGGKLIIPVGDENQIMIKLIRKNETQFEKHECGDFKFVPLLEDKK